MKNCKCTGSTEDESMVHIFKTWYEIGPDRRHSFRRAVVDRIVAREDDEYRQVRVLLPALSNKTIGFDCRICKHKLACLMDQKARLTFGLP